MTIKIKIDAKGIEQMMQQVQAQMQGPANDLLRDTIRGVRDDMEGQPANEVYVELDQRLREAFGGNYTPNEANLRQVAEEIEAGTLTG